MKEQCIPYHRNPQNKTEYLIHYVIEEEDLEWNFPLLYDMHGGPDCLL